MTLFGCCPKLAILGLPYVILSLIVMYNYPGFRFDRKNIRLIRRVSNKVS